MKATLLTSILALGSTAVAVPSPLKRPCTYSEVALASGIHLNINGQYTEYNATLFVEQVEKAHPSGPTPAFYEAKGKLEAAVQGGMNIRLFNQQIANRTNNPAVPGLEKYALAEETEKAQSMNLTGVYATDEPVFAMLKSEIMQGIQLNEDNLQSAVSECDFTLVFPPANEMGM